MFEMKNKLLKHISEKYHLGELDIKESHFVDKEKFVDDIKHAVHDYHSEVDSTVDQKAFNAQHSGHYFDISLDDSIVKSY